MKTKFVPINKLFFILFVLLMLLMLIGCNTIVGASKGVGRDIKATYIYTRDAFSGNPISNNSKE